jgi:hemerythrin superfamily protein
MDAITLLKRDHERVEKLFKQYEDAGPRAYKTKRGIVDRIIRELVQHAEIEEQVFYPAVREMVPDEEDLVLESLEEHHLVEVTLAELDGMDPEEERFDAKVRVLIEHTRHHVEEEETELFPAVRDALGRKQLTEIAERMEHVRKAAPTRPHPRSPDTPPGNVITGAAAGVIDGVRDAVRRR